jgi:UDP-3-O-[3-hydroxymyristoyl] glucosamine N-acyltransferase
VLGGRALLASLEDDAEVALGLGENEMRAEVAQAVLRWGRGLATVVHPSAVIARGVSLGPGTYVAPLAVLHTDAQVGRGCIVNSGAVVEHDCRLGDWVHVSPGAALGGGVRIGDSAHVVRRDRSSDWRLAPGHAGSRGRHGSFASDYTTAVRVPAQ